MSERVGAKYVASLAKVAREYGLSFISIGDVRIVVGPPIPAPRVVKAEAEPEYPTSHDRDELDTEAIDNDRRFIEFSQRGVNPVGGR